MTFNTENFSSNDPHAIILLILMESGALYEEDNNIDITDKRSHYYAHDHNYQCFKY